MLKKLFAPCAVAAIAYGWTAMAGTVPNVEGNDCSEACAPSIVTPEGHVCVLADCLQGGGQTFCLYNCFFVLPF